MERAVRMAVAMRDDVRRSWPPAGASAASSSASASGSRPATPPWAASASKAATTTPRIGNAVAIAARLSSQATNGQILVSQRTLAAVDDAVHADAIEGLELKGVSHPVTAWSVTALRE